MNKKLRLLVTTRCPNKCPMCCNNQFDFSKLPVVDRWNYDEIMITGGEPLLYGFKLIALIHCIKYLCNIMGIPIPKFYLYTSISNYNQLRGFLTVGNGVVVTPHSKKDLKEFIDLNLKILSDVKWGFDTVNNKSLRLNLFPDMKALLPKDIDLSLWQVKDMEWIENCPVPEGEDFRRIANLW